MTITIDVELRGADIENMCHLMSVQMTIKAVLTGIISYIVHYIHKGALPD